MWGGQPLGEVAPVLQQIDDAGQKVNRIRYQQVTQRGSQWRQQFQFFVLHNTSPNNVALLLPVMRTRTVSPMW